MNNYDLLKLSLSQSQILEALAKYKFLTTGQLLQLGIMSDRANLNKQIALLRKYYKPLIASITFGVHPQLGKLENIHHLTAFGAGVLWEQYGEQYAVRFPKGGGNGLFRQDYFHRIHTVTIHIHFEQWAKQNFMEIVYFRTYFDKIATGKENGYRAETMIKMDEKEYLIADAICLLESVRRKELYAIELYNGNDTNRVYHSLFQHLKALNNGEPSGRFGLQYGSRVLCIFEWDSYKLQAMKRLQEDARFAAALEHFLFLSLEEMQAHSLKEWRAFDGTKRELL